MLQRKGQAGVYRGEPSLAAMLTAKRRVSKLIAKDVKNNNFSFKPVRHKLIQREHKKRSIYLMDSLDSVVASAVADVLRRELEESISDDVYSYRTGRNRLQPLYAFARFLRQHSRSKPLKERGLFVLRADVSNYTESIPTRSTAPLWEMFEPLFKRASNESYPHLLTLVKQSIRPVVTNYGDAPCSFLRGIPTGSPVSTVIANLYLGPLDRRLGEVGGAFYSRFGDDILFAHEDEQTFKKAVESSRAVLEELELSWNEDKQLTTAFNGAGRSIAGYKGSQKIEYLGCAVDFKATVSLGKWQCRKLLRDLRRFLNKVPENLSSRERVQLSVDIVNQHLTRKDREGSLNAQFLLGAVNDRGQLKTLDYQIALLIAETFCDTQGVKALRQMPPRLLYDEYKLHSLSRLRNRIRRGKRKK